MNMYSHEKDPENIKQVVKYYRLNLYHLVVDPHMSAIITAE